MWFKWLFIWCFLMYHSTMAQWELTFDPMVTFQPNVTLVNRIFSCKVVSPSDRLTHTYHIFEAPDVVYRFDELDQTTDSWNFPHQFMELECYGDMIIGVFAYDVASPFAKFTLREDGLVGSAIPDRPDDTVTDLHATYFGSQRVVLVNAITMLEGTITPYSYYYDSVNNVQVTPDAIKTSNIQQFVPATVLFDNITNVIVSMDNNILEAVALSAVQGLRTFQIDLSGTQANNVELFWNPPNYFITFDNVDGVYIVYSYELDPTATSIFKNSLISVKTIMLKSTRYPEWNGALFSFQSLAEGNYLFGLLPNGTLIINKLLTDFEIIGSDHVMSIEQLDEASFVNQWNGTTLKSIVARVGFGSIPISINPVSAPVDVTPPAPDIVVVSFNSTTTVTTLILTNNSVLVVTNEAVIEVSDCAALAGKLQYVLSENQYNSLLQNNTLDILVLLTQCSNGTFDSTEVIFEGADQNCVDLFGEPKPAPGQLTLLVTKSQKDCNSNVVQDPLTTGAIIGIVVGCAAAVVLIIILALYFSPMRAKVFPYAPQNKK